MNGKKEDIFMFVFVAAFLITVFFLCTGRTSVHDLRERVEPIRAGLNNAREEQQREADAIERASEAARRSTEAISNSQQSATKIKRIEQDDIELIRECQSIIGAVRERGSVQD